MECRAASHDLVKAQPIEVAKFPMNGGPLASPGDHGQEPRLRFDVLGLGLNLLREVLQARIGRRSEAEIPSGTGTRTRYQDETMRPCSSLTWIVCNRLAARMVG